MQEQQRQAINEVSHKKKPKPLLIVSMITMYRIYMVNPKNTMVSMAKKSWSSLLLITDIFSKRYLPMRMASPPLGFLNILYFQLIHYWFRIRHTCRF